MNPLYDFFLPANTLRILGALNPYLVASAAESNFLIILPDMSHCSIGFLLVPL